MPSGFPVSLAQRTANALTPADAPAYVDPAWTGPNGAFCPAQATAFFDEADADDIDWAHDAADQLVDDYSSDSGSDTVPSLCGDTSDYGSDTSDAGSDASDSDTDGAPDDHDVTTVVATVYCDDIVLSSLDLENTPPARGWSPESHESDYVRVLRLSSAH